MAVIRDVDSRNLGYFRAVVRLGSIRAAADHVHVAPSAISRQISDLEMRLGVRLLERLARGVKPTAAGEIVAAFAREEDDRHEILLDRLRAARQRQDGHVAIACGEGYLPDLLENSLRAFAARYPDVTLALTTAGTADLAERVAGGEADLGLVFAPGAHPDTESLRVVETPLMAILPAGHPLSEDSPMALSAVGDTKVAALSGGRAVRTLLSRAEADAQVRLNVAYESTSIDAVLRVVKSGAAITFLPRFAAAEALAAGAVTVRPLQDAALTHATTHLIARRGRTPPDAVRRMSDHLLQTLEVLNPTFAP